MSEPKHRRPSVRLQVVYRPADQLRLHPSNARKHTAKQLRQLGDSIARYGFTNPILVDRAGSVLAGHGRLESAKLAGLKSVPTICLDHLSDAEKAAYRIADNKLGDNSSFDRKLLAKEMALVLEADPDFDLEITGFELNEIELLLDQADDAVAIEELPQPVNRSLPALCRKGDLWTLGSHRLLCANALERDSYIRLMGRDRARMIFVDPPYNQKIANISGKGKVKHREFEMASGEMDESEYIAFLTTACTLAAKASVDGALHYWCIDWQHQFELLTAGRAAYDGLKNICVWAKSGPGMSTFYRSQTEFIVVFKRGTRPHVQNIELGKHGRNRSNLWHYSSGPNFSPKRQEELAWHATVKPLELVQDALLDASRRDDIVLDGFGGSGTTLIAAERTGRRARLIEIDPYYCDIALRRFEALTGAKARSSDGETLLDREDQNSRLPSSTEGQANG